MRILHVVRQYLPSIGGLEEVVRNLVAGQLHSGRHEPRIITLDRLFRDPQQRLPASDCIDGVPVTRLAYRGSERYPLAPQVLSHLKEADIIHVHGIDFFYDYLAVTRVLHRKPLLASTHGGFFHTAFAQKIKKAYFHTVTRATSTAYDRVVCTSENDGTIFSQIVSPARMRVIENGVDINKYHDAASHILQPCVIYFGRWSINKGLIKSLEFFARLRGAQPDQPWHFIIAGREYDLDEAVLREHIQRLKIGQAVTIASNPSNDQLRALIKQASYYICMSRHEGFGIAPIEAMSAGLMPWLSDIPPFSRLVHQSSLGHLLIGDAQENALKLAAQHENFMREGQDAHRRLRHKLICAAAPYSWQGVQKKYLQEYDLLMHESI